MMLSPTGETIPPRRQAEVAELADALDSKSSVPKGRVGSSPTFGNPAITPRFQQCTMTPRD